MLSLIAGCVGCGRSAVVNNRVTYGVAHSFARNAGLRYAAMNAVKELPEEYAKLYEQLSKTVTKLDAYVLR